MDFRFPLAGSYNTRVTETNVLSSESGIVGLGIVGIMVVGAAEQSTDKDQRFINCFTETVVNPYTLTKTLYLVKRPGFSALNTPAAGSIGTAILVWTGFGAGTSVITAFGGTNSTIYSGTGSLGAITGKATAITETVISNVPTLAITSADSTGWYHDTTVPTKISDGDFPGNAGKTLAGTFAHMDGYAFILDTLGNLWNSDLNSIAAWTATSSIPANSYPDRGVGCVRLKDKIAVFGTESTQFYYNAGNPTGSPLSRIESLTIRVGCVSADAIAKSGDAVYWAGSSPEGGLSVYQYGASFKKISTPEIEGILILAGAANISLAATTFYGRNFIIVNAASVTLVYCVEENAWHEWNSTTRLWYKCSGVSSGSTQVIYAISNISTSGKVFTINPAALTYQDNGAAYTARIQTSRVGEGNHRTFWEEVEIIGDQQSSSSPLGISYASDDYQNYVMLGTVDLSDLRPRLTRCGSDYRRVWVLTHAANTPMRIEALAGRKSIGQ